MTGSLSTDADASNIDDSMARRVNKVTEGNFINLSDRVEFIDYDFRDMKSGYANRSMLPIQSVFESTALDSKPSVIQTSSNHSDSKFEGIFSQGSPNRRFARNLPKP